MSVVFRKNDQEPERYHIVITVEDATLSPAEDLKNIINDMLDCLRDANIDNKDETYFYMLDFLQQMTPDEETFKSYHTPVAKKDALTIDVPPFQMMRSLLKVQKHLFDYAAATDNKELEEEIPKLVEDLNVLQEVLKKMNS